MGGMKTLHKMVCVLAAAFLASCGKGTGTVSFVGSLSSSSPGLLAKGSLTQSPAALALTTFKVCIKKIKLEDESGEAQRGESEEDEIEFKPGLVDLSSLSTAEATIGTLENAPVGFKISKIKIKVRKDESLCGSGTHAIEINNGSNYTTDDEIEFKWKFNPAVELEGSDTVQLAFSEFVTALTSISSNSDFSTAIPNAEGTARIKER
jgi:hypothetical protein